jgi:hypothetical protein
VIFHLRVPLVAFLACISFAQADEGHFGGETAAPAHKTISLKEQFQKIRAADFWSESGHDALAIFCGSLLPKLSESAREYLLQRTSRAKDLSPLVEILASEHIELNPKDQGDLRMLYDLKEQLKANLQAKDYDGLQVLFDQAAGSSDMTSLRGITTRAAQAAIRRELRLNKDTVDYFKSLGHNAHETLSLVAKIKETTNLLKGAGTPAEKKAARESLKFIYTQLVEANGLTRPMGPKVEPAVRELMTLSSHFPLTPEEKRLAVAQDHQTYVTYREDLTKSAGGDEAAAARLRKNYPNLLSFGMALQNGPQEKYRPLIVSAALGPGTLISPPGYGKKPIYEWKIPVTVGARQNLQGGDLAYGAPESALAPNARSQQMIVLQAGSQKEAAEKIMKFNHQGKYDNTFAYVRTRDPEFEPKTDPSPVGPAMGTLATGIGETITGRTTQGLTRILSAISNAQREAQSHVTLDEQGKPKYEGTWDELRREAVSTANLVRNHIAQADLERFVAKLGEVKNENVRLNAVNLRKQLTTNAAPYEGSLTPRQAMAALKEHRYPSTLLVPKLNSEGVAIQVPVRTESAEGILALAAVLPSGNGINMAAGK